MFKFFIQFKSYKNLKRISLAVAVIIIILAGKIGYDAYRESKKPRFDYVAAVQVTDQAGDLSSALKAGDVVVIFKGEHNWSQTEKSLWLMARLRLTEDQAQKLTDPKTRDLTSDEIKARLPEDNKLSKDEREQREKEVESEKVTTVARAYRIDFKKLRIADPVAARDQGVLDGKELAWEDVERK